MVKTATTVPPWPSVTALFWMLMLTGGTITRPRENSEVPSDPVAVATTKLPTVEVVLKVRS